MSREFHLDESSLSQSKPELKRETLMHRELYEMEPHEKECRMDILELLSLEDIEEPTRQLLKLKASLKLTRR